MARIVFFMMVLVVFASGFHYPVKAEDKLNMKDIQYRAEIGVPAAQEILGIQYMVGKNIPKDETKGVFWLKKAAAQGRPSAQYVLGRFYVSGQGVQKDFEKGHSLITAASNGGYEDATEWLRKLSEEQSSEFYVDPKDPNAEMYYAINDYYGCAEAWAEKFAVQEGTPDILADGAIGKCNAERAKALQLMHVAVGQDADQIMFRKEIELKRSLIALILEVRAR